MKVKCIKCQTIYDLNEEEVADLARMVRKYNSGAKAVNYVEVLSVIMGDCPKDNMGKRHIINFEESFDKEIAELVKECKTLSQKFADKKEEIKKIENLTKSTLSQIKTLENTVKELNERKESVNKDIESTGDAIDTAMQKFEKVTGTRDVSMWS